ncbi:MAG: glycosyltransferase family 4 protein [Tatlockia sp.]|nr:glycosyltransferase family 4 protein [Tatlockia sp.]
MNILYTNFHPHYGGGHTTYLRYLLRNATNKNFLACPKTSQLYQILEKKGEGEGEVTLFDVSFPSKFKDIFSIVKSIFKIARIIKKNDIDLVHTNENADNRIIFYASLLTRKKFKVVLTKHNAKGIKKRITSRLRFNKFNSAVIYVSKSVVNTIGVSDIKVPVHIIENGVDTDYWQLKPGPPSPILTLVSIAGTAPCKGLKHLIQAIKKLPADKKKQLRVKIVGKLLSTNYIDSEFEGDYCPEVVSFVGYREEAKNELIGADLGFVLSDSEETISFACREMMSCGLPVLVSDIGCLPDNVDHGVSGWVTKRADVNAIFEALLDILNKTPSELSSMKKAARQKALASFGVDLMIEKTQKVYASLKT